MEHPCTPPVPPGDELARHRVVSRSLADRHDYFLIGASLLFGLGASAAICFPVQVGLPLQYSLGERPWIFAAPIALGPFMLTAVLIATVLTPWRRGLELEWLAGLPFQFSHRGYLTLLNRESGGNRLELVLSFDHEPVHEDFEALCRRRLPGSKLRWEDGHAVMVASPAALEGRERRVYTNARLHRWFRRTAGPWLATLHEKAGLLKVNVRG
jgi:hypothetical protein